MTFAASVIFQLRQRWF